VITVHRKSASARRDRGARTVLAVFSFRYDAHLVPGLLANIEPMVDGWISYDDRGSDVDFSDEPARRQALLQAARQAGADWILAPDPDERFEKGLALAMPSLTCTDGPVAFTFAFRELYAPDRYRTDGIWGRKSQTRLFRLPATLAPSPRPLHSAWHELVPGAEIRESGFNVYHLKMITAERRRARAALYNRLDPDRQCQSMGYDYLADDEGAVFAEIPAGREYHPVHVEDGGLWMPASVRPQSI
jgi:hypothetical protein